MSEASDARMMRRAIALAQDVLGQTWPNPPVGCVIVAGGIVVGEAATAPGGRPHAEEQALAVAEDRAAGGAAYVTLEPCGERSSGAASCAVRLIEAGVSRVVVACADRSVLAAGRGLQALQEAGIQVEIGLLEDEAACLYADYVPAEAMR